MLTNNSETVSKIPAASNPEVSSDSSKEPYIFPPNNKAKADDHPFLGTKSGRKFEYIDCDNEEQRKLLFSNSPDDSEKENKYHGKYVTGQIIEDTKKEIAKHVKGNALRSVQLRVRSPINTMLTARIVLNNEKEELRISNFLTSEFCKKSHITAFTLLLPDQDEKRGIRGRIDEHGTRIYEVANGSYEMTLKWYVEGKECNIKINIHDNGAVELIEGNGVTKEQLAANNVKIGRQYEAKPLHEALASQLPQTQLQQSSEEVKFLEQHSTNVEDLSGASQKHQVSAAQNR